MSADISALTDKEKEALRLLLEGHDTKSSANLLGLSVHTINDRLRNARRKMGVGSSREAARILRDTEGETPQTSAENPQSVPETNAHTSFGMSDQAPLADTAVLTQTHQKQPNRLIWLAGGMLIMSIVIAAAALLSSSAADTATQPSPIAFQDQSERDAPEASAGAVSLAANFVQRVDAFDWEGSWNIAGAFFQSQSTSRQWGAIVDPLRRPLGAVETRTLAGVQRTRTLPGAPDADYEILQFETKFVANSSPLIETVVMMQSENGWQVAGYFIR